MFIFISTLPHCFSVDFLSPTAFIYLGMQKLLKMIMLIYKEPKYENNLLAA